MTLPTSPTIGFTLPQRGVFFGVTTVAEMLALAAKVDANPLFGSIWVGDSLGAKPRPDSLTLLGALASATQRIRLGVGCMASFPVRDPLVFAYQWATLDLISNGRMLLAACTGLVAGGASARGRRVPRRRPGARRPADREHRDLPPTLVRRPRLLQRPLSLIRGRHAGAPTGAAAVPDLDRVKPAAAPRRRRTRPGASPGRAARRRLDDDTARRRAGEEQLVRHRRRARAARPRSRQLSDDGVSQRQLESGSAGGARGVKALPGRILRSSVLATDGGSMDGGGRARAVCPSPGRAARGGTQVRHTAHHVVAPDRPVRAPGRRAASPRFGSQIETA